MAPGNAIDERLRVCMLVTYDLASPGGGVARHAMQLAEALRRRGDEVTLVAPSSRPIDEPNVQTFGGIVNIPSNGSDNFLGLLASPRAIARYFRAHPFDVMHVHEPLNPALAYWAVWATRQVPHVATFHAYAETEGRLLRWGRRLGGGALFSSFDRAIAVSEAASRYAAVAWRAPMTIIPNGVPCDQFTPVPPGDEVPAGGDRLVKLLFVGRLGDRRKGHRFALDAYRGLRARGLPVTLDMVGELGSAEPPPALPGFTYHGAVSTERLRELYAACDVFVAPSTGQESFGIVLIEAMASGKVVVCSDIDGYREVVAETDTLRVPPCDARALEEALVKVVALPAEERRRQGEANRRHAERFDWERITDRVRAEYVAAIAGRAARRRASETAAPSTLDAPALAPVVAPVHEPLRGPVMSRRTAAALLALCAALRVVSLFRPCLSDDEATYAVVGREMLHGRALYKDVVDHKPPAIYLVNETMQALGGPTGGMVLLHALLILVVWATGLLLAQLVHRWGATGEDAARPGRAGPCDPRGPPLAALLWIVFTTTLVDVDGLAANCELFMMLPLVASASVFLGARDRLGKLVLAGALVGLAMLFKYQAGIQLALYGGAWLVVRRRAPGRVVLGGLALALGAALPIGAAIAYLAAHGALAAAWFWFRFNFAYISQGPSRLDTLARVGFAIVAAAPLYVLAARSLRRPRAPFTRFALAWLAVSALAVMVGGRFFGHYFHQVTAPLVVLAAPAALALRRRRPRLFCYALAIPAAIFLVLGVAHDRVMRLAGQPDPDYGAVAAWLDAHGAPDDALCIWGNSPVLYFDADRPLGCRFVFANYITGLSPATPSQTDPHVDSSNNAVPQAWPMMAADLAARRPAFVVDGSPGNVGFYGKYPPSAFPIGRVLACAYAPAATIAGMRIYRRLAAPRCTP